MKHSIAFIYQYIVLVSMALLITPAKSVHTCIKGNEIKIEKKRQPIVQPNTSEVLHGEILFRY